MYGLVNEALRQFIATRFGPSAWASTQAAADLDDDRFVSTAPYPDALTYRLVHAACDATNEPAPRFLEAFGRFYIAFIAATPYGSFLSLYGRSPRDVLINLDTMHARISASLPSLVPPSFRCTGVTADRMVLHYHSTREHLAPFVVGLVEGLGDYYATPIRISQIAARSDGHDHDQFLIEFPAQN